MAQRAQILVAKVNNQRWIPLIIMVEGEDQFPKRVF